MGLLDGLDSKNVNTSDIIKILVHTFTKYIEKEPELLEKAIEEIDKYLATKTPRYMKDKEPKYDSLGKISFPGDIQQTLYQFDPDNVIAFSKYVREVDRAMKVIPSVAMEIRRQLKESQQTGMPVSTPISVPKQEEKPSILEKIGLKKEPDKMSKADSQVEALISHIYEVRDKWVVWNEYFYGAIKYDTNNGTWSDIYSRDGMENFLTRLREFFNFWIVKKFLPIHQYAMDLELTGLKTDVNDFVKAVARMQHETQMNPQA